jgi:two-component system, response regulator YesN
MKKVYLVDDEIVIRENIRDAIDWRKEGFEYCGDASDGEVALPEIEKLRPDILITDIKMPFMNGIELGTIVRQRYPDMKIIILSGHDEFEYARQAIKIGVAEYCLKPVGSVDMIQMLRKISTRIDQELRDKEEIEQLKLSLSEEEDSSRDKLLASLCNGFISSAEAIEKAEQLGINLIARHYSVIVTDIRSSDEETVLIPELVQQVEQKLAQILLERVEFYAYKRNRTETIWLLKSEQPEHLHTAIHDLMRITKGQLEAQFSCSIVFGVGSIHNRLQAVHASYLQAEEDKHWRRLSSQNKRSLINLTEHIHDPAVFLDRTGFIDFLKQGYSAQAEAFIHTFANDLKTIEWKKTLYGYYLLIDLTLEVIRSAKHLYRSTDSSGDILHALQKDIDSIRTWDEACRYLIKLAEQFWLWRSSSAVKYVEIIEKVKAFVRSNYDNCQLSLQDAADHVSVSPSHLSKVFSQETGQTYIEFMMQTRIHKAMELLHSSHSKSYEIAYQVGYQDPHYFSNLFKKVTGMNIREFRKQGIHAETSRTQKGQP